MLSNKFSLQLTRSTTVTKHLCLHIKLNVEQAPVITNTCRKILQNIRSYYRNKATRVSTDDCENIETVIRKALTVDLLDQQDLMV